MNTKTEDTTVDVEITNHGSIFLFQPLTDSAREWIEENVSEDAQWFGGALAVEHGYAADLAIGMQGDGLVVV